MHKHIYRLTKCTANIEIPEGMGFHILFIDVCKICGRTKQEIKDQQRQEQNFPLIKFSVYCKQCGLE